MSEFETRFGTDDDAEQIRAAFYGFIQQYADDADFDGDAHISTEIDNGDSKLRVRLWNAEAMDAFLVRLPDVIRADRTPCFE